MDPTFFHYVHVVVTSGILSNLDKCEVGNENFSACMTLVSRALSQAPVELLQTLVTQPQVTPDEEEETSSTEASNQDLSVADVRSINLSQQELADAANSDDQDEELVFDMEHNHGNGNFSLVTFELVLFLESNYCIFIYSR